MRTVDFRGTQPAKRRLFGLLPSKNDTPYVLSYEADNRYGERVRYVRSLSQGGVEMIGSKLAQFPPGDRRIGNISVTRPGVVVFWADGDDARVPVGPDVSHWFRCFTGPALQATAPELNSLLWMLTFEPSKDV